jgi:hypothetical protein
MPTRRSPEGRARTWQPPPYPSRAGDGAALDDALERLDELGDVGDAALQQVTAALAAREQVHGVLDLDVCGEDEDGGLGGLFTDLASGVEPFGVCVGGIRISTIAGSGCCSRTSASSSPALSH